MPMTSPTTWPCAAVPNAELASYTTMRVGGRARWLLEPARPAELVEGYRAAKEAGFDVRLLGGGANVLLPDETIDAVVIRTARLDRLFRPDREEGSDWAEGAEERVGPESVGRVGAGGDGSEPARLVAWAGKGLLALVRAARDLGWSGLEPIAGIPGHLGGGVAMNAGGRYGELWDVVERVHLLLPNGEQVERERAECMPTYRNGNLGDAVVLGAVLRLERDQKPRVDARVREILREKAEAQPLQQSSCGCVFRNPDPELSDGRSAGKLIEDCGGKGLARGAARVSDKHANFIVNTGAARAADVRALIEDVRRLVRDRSGVELATEVKIWSAERGG